MKANIGDVVKGICTTTNIKLTGEVVEMKGEYPHNITYHIKNAKRVDNGQEWPGMPYVYNVEVHKII